jgi:V/A-type H+/Na+-transporting ATPase subunit A
VNKLHGRRRKMETNIGKGTVIAAQGNLITFEFEGDILQSEVVYVKVGDKKLKGEVLEVDENRAKIQVFEITKGVTKGVEVELTHDLLVAELGPGLLKETYDGLQNPLHELSEKVGYFLTRGVYVTPLNKKNKWEWTPTAKVGDKLERADVLGTVPESIFTHKVMVPFGLVGKYELTWIKEKGNYTVDEVIAKLKSKDGKEIEVTMVQKWPIKKILRFGKRILPKKPLVTGFRIIDTYFPVCQGGTFCVPGPFGSGKTVLQQTLSRHAQIDIVIIVACGERAGEVVETIREFPELKDPRTGKSLIDRTVIICNTSSMPVAARESSVYIGMSIGEFYRQMGLNVLVLADSTSRWAQALREMSGRLEEIPGEEAYPAYLASRIFELYERAGEIITKDGSNGSLTLGGNVSPAGGNFDEPVTQSTLAVVGGFLGLTYARSYAKRYPAIDPLISWSKYLEQGKEEFKKLHPDWIKMVDKAKSITVEGSEIKRRMEVVGEEGTAISDFIIYMKAEMFDAGYLQQNSFDKVDVFCPLDRQVELFLMMQDIFDKEFEHIKNHDNARSYFVRLSTEFKQLNRIEYKTDDYNKQKENIENMVENYEEVIKSFTSEHV